MKLVEIADAVCRDNPEVPSRTLAKVLMTTHPELFTSMERARHAIRAARGSTGSRRRRSRPGRPHLKTEQSVKMEVSNDQLHAEGKSPVRITSLEQLLAFFQVDRGEWVVDRWECTSWESQAKNDNTQQVQVTPLYRVRATFKRCKPMLDARREVEGFKEALRKFAPPSFKPPRKCVGEGVLLEIAIPDLHHGKLAWGDETGGEDWDSKISERTFLAAVEGLVGGAQGLKVSRVLLPLGNDFLNVDNHLNQTTGGTPQDEDTRWKKSFVTARAMAMKAIAGLAANVAPVEVVIVPGNHDEERIFYLGDALECAFHRQKFVSVHNEPPTRKYFQWGKNLIGFTHGKYEKHAQLPQIMAMERPKEWSETRFREWHIGHWHHLRNRIFEPDVDADGTLIRFLPSLCPPDAWHAKSGHISAQRQAMGLAFHPLHGLERLWPWRVG